MSVKIEYLLVVFLLRECLYFYSTQKLINKLMARNYHDYNFSKNVAKTMVQDSNRDPELGEAIAHEGSLAEDLSPLREFQGLN